MNAEKYDAIVALAMSHTPSPKQAPETIANLVTIALGLAVAYTGDESKARDLMVSALNAGMTALHENLKKLGHPPQ